MEYEKERDRTVRSFNSLMNSIARGSNIGLKKHALGFSEKFASFMEYTLQFEQLFVENEVLESKSNKLELLLSLFLPFSMHQTISESEILEMKRLQLGNYYAIKSFINDSSMVSEVNMLRGLGFRFKKGLTREELAIRVDECRKKLIKTYANSPEQSKAINR